MQIATLQNQKPASDALPQTAAVEGVESSRQECPITGTVGVTSNCPMRHVWNWFSGNSEFTLLLNYLKITLLNLALRTSIRFACK